MRDLSEAPRDGSVIIGILHNDEKVKVYFDTLELSSGELTGCWVECTGIGGAQELIGWEEITKEDNNEKIKGVGYINDEKNHIMISIENPTIVINNDMFLQIVINKDNAEFIKSMLDAIL
jgi:hypothetical protein